METHNNLHNRFAEIVGLRESVPTTEEEANCIGMVLFKPDATVSSLDIVIENFIRDELERTSKRPISIFAIAQIRLDKKTIEKLYPEQQNKQHLKYTVDGLTAGPINLILVASPNAPEELNRLKGSVQNNSGVRGKFAMTEAIPSEKLKLWKEGLLDEGETARINTELFTKSLIHVPDDKKDTKRTIVLLYSKKEISDLLSAVPIFARWYESIE